MELEGNFLALENLIDARDASNLAVAACFFKDPERKQAFQTTYSFMRMIDDFADSFSEKCDLEEQLGIKKEKAPELILNCQKLISFLYEHDKNNENFLNNEFSSLIGKLPPAVRSFDFLSLKDALAKFQIPISLWNNFFKSMLLDVKNEQFDTFRDFFEYAEGASVAPTTIFIILIASEKNELEDNYKEISNFDFLKCGQNLGRWAYMLHILRDLKSDVLTGSGGSTTSIYGRLFIPKEFLQKYQLTFEDLKASAKVGFSNQESQKMVLDYLTLAEAYGLEGKKIATKLGSQLPCDRRQVLGIIVALYTEIASKIRFLQGEIFKNESLLPYDRRLELVKRVTGKKEWAKIINFWI